MIIYPYLALSGGRCVTLSRGKIDEPITYDFDPLEKAAEFAHDGAQWIQVVDLDAVKATGDNTALIRELILHTPAAIMVGGGVSTPEKVREWVEAGAGRVIFGTAAVRSAQMVREVSYAYPDQVAISVDVWQGKVMIDGWRQATAFGAVDFVHQFDGWPLSQIIFTDIDRDLEMPESSLAMLTRLASETKTPVIASGFARSLDEISALKYVYNISGAVVGRGLHDGSYTLKEALKLAQPDPEPIAEFV